MPMGQYEDYQQTMSTKPTMWRAAKAGDVKTLTSLAGDLSEINKKDEKGYSPLMYAAYYGHISAAQYLIDQGASVHSTDAGGNSILMGACFKGHVDVVEILLGHGADRNFKNQQGLTAIDFARMFGRFNLVQKLERKKTPKAIQFIKSLNIWLAYLYQRITKRSLQ